MATFNDIIADLILVVENKNARTETFLRTSLAQALREVSSVRTLFMEGKTTFDTVVNQSDYTTADAGFPTDLLSVDALFFTSSGGWSYLADPILHGPIPIRELRNAARYPYVNGRPTHFAYHHGKLILWPTPTVAEELTLEYFKDATRDSTGGGLITAASTTATSEWFDRGAQVIKSWVLFDYHSTISMNTDRAAMAMQRYSDGVDKLAAEVSLKSQHAAAPDWNFG